MAGNGGETRKGWYAAVGTVSALLFLLLRLMAVTRYDWRTAFTLAGTMNFSDSLGVVVGSVLGAGPLMAYLLAVLAPVLLAHHVRVLREQRPGLLVVVLGAFVLFIAAVITFRLWGAVALASVCGVATAAIEWRGGAALRRMRELTAHGGALTLAALLIAAAATPEVWVSEERLTVDGAVVYGYVMQVEPGFVTILTEHDRKVEIVPVGKVTDREDAS